MIAAETASGFDQRDPLVGPGAMNGEGDQPPGQSAPDHGDIERVPAHCRFALGSNAELGNAKECKGH